MQPADASVVATPERKGATRLARIQAVSGLVFGVFLVLHLATTMSGIGGPAAYDRTIAALRHVYRPHLLVELLLICLAGGVHVGCAIARMVQRGQVVALGRSWQTRAHRSSGYFLLLVVVGHALATRVLAASGSGPTATGAADFSYLAYAVLRWPVLFVPYYVLLGLCGAVHLCLGALLASRILFPRRLTALGTRRALVGIAAFVLAVAIGIAGILLHAPSTPRHRFPEYQAVFDGMWRAFDRLSPASEARLR